MERKNDKYEYIPDVSHIMKQAGYTMNLMEILADHSFEKKRRAVLSTAPEIFYYQKGDINGE